MGLANATLGFSSGIVTFVLPQLMGAEHIPEGRIAVITAVGFSPNFWFFLLSPVLDVRFSRRWYAAAFAALAGLATAVAIPNLRHLAVLEISMVVISASSMLSASALAGWLSNITEPSLKNHLSKWMNIALISGAGMISLLGGTLIAHLPVLTAAMILGAIVFAPAVIFAFIPAPGPDRRLAGESFSQFNREVLSLLKRREVVIVLLLFLSPCSTFVLPNLLGGLGGDFHASQKMISLAGGVGAFIPGILGCFVFPPIARKLPLRFFYLANGIAGSLFTLSLLLLPASPLAFGIAVFGEFLFQAVCFSVQIGIIFEALGADNPLAATTFSFLTAATNVPATLVMLADGRAYSHGGITAEFTVDALIGIVTCLLAGTLLARYGSTISVPATHKATLVSATQEEN
jgi:PAT family beta-lactamase induction signal transducer AmpG